MELKDTIADMISDSYVDRYRAEYKQLCIRIDKLVEYLKHYNVNNSCIEVELKAQQLQYMIAYKNVLELRAAIDKIDL